MPKQKEKKKRLTKCCGQVGRNEENHVRLLQQTAEAQN